MRIRLFTLLLLLAATLFVQGQVSLQTGAAQFSLPLYSYADGANGIGCSLSLDYVSGNGLRVNDIGSSVGTGWSLSTGGVIERAQRGEPDDQVENIPTNIHYNDLDYVNRYYPNGYLYSGYSPTDRVTDGGAYNPIRPGKWKQPKQFLADREQDVFSFSFNGRAGEFVIGRNGVISTIEDSKLKVDKVLLDMTASKIRTRIAEFHIIDENGIKYIFKDLGLSEVVVYDKHLDRYKNPIEYPQASAVDFVTYGRGLGEYVATKWYLSEIKNPRSGKSIRFVYEQYEIDINGSLSIQKSQEGGSGKSGLTYTMSKIKGKELRIKEIQASGKERVLFHYFASLRQDLPSDRALQRIEIAYNGSVKYSWNFSFNYIIRNTVLPMDYSAMSTERPYMRLYLASVQKKGQGTSQELPYEFAYHLPEPSSSSGVPARFSYYHDHWGYSNATSNYWTYRYEPGDDVANILGGAYDYQQAIANPVAKRGIVNDMARFGIIKTIKYPTESKLTYEYTQNTVLHNGVVRPRGGVRVSKTVVNDGISSSNDISTDYAYVKEDGNTSGWGYEDPVYSMTNRYRIYKCGDYKEPAINLHQAITAIPSVINTAASLGLLKRGSFLKHVFTEQPILGPFVVSLALQIVVNYLSNVLGPDSKEFTNTSNSDFAFNYGNELPFQYARVKVSTSQTSLINGSPQLLTNGETIYEFTSNTTYSELVPEGSYGFPYSNKQRYARWAYGLPRKVIVKDKSGAIKKVTENHYGVSIRLTEDANHASQKWSPHFQEFNCWTKDGLLQSTGTSYITHDIYYTVFGGVTLLSTEETILNASGQSTVSAVQYRNHGSNLLPKEIVRSNSRGEEVKTRIRYPEDYAASGFVKTLQDNNMVNATIGSFSYITKNGTNEYMTGGSVTEFASIANGDIKPINIYSFRADKPVEGSLVPIGWDNPIPNQSYFKLSQSMTFEPSGQVNAVSTEKGKASSLYDYEDRFLVASITNAAPAEVAYTSFEDKSSGGWSFDPQYAGEDFSPTGRKHFKLTASGGASIISFSFDQTKKYILSFWSKGGVPIIYKRTANLGPGYRQLGTQLKSFANAVTGWTYYEYEITGTSSVYLDNSFAGINEGPYPEIALDEVRLYPKEAGMVTYTYDPLIGKTSESDVNGRITYYSYDNLGRLKTVRDEHRNVIKAYEYHTKTIYYNKAVSRTFTRECPSGYSGTEVTYYVPDRKHQSDISQPDADLKAENDLRDNGQNYANDPANGGQCIPPTVYAAISYENTFTSGTDYYGDVVVRFYSDQGLTQPISVNNYTFSYVKEDPCGSGWQSYTITASGDTYAIAYSTLLEYANWTYDPWWGWYETTCYIDYYL